MVVRGESTFVEFFFSSRRRHTRLVSDWSSDVCSSDLARAVKKRHRVETFIAGARCKSRCRPPRLVEAKRSEERRVGKECRSRGSADNFTKIREREDNGNELK